jgi:hypothetical protein|tara:strand:- start:373 stop:594 length:222 start_codon:yes stop_codon:yes gene_type:complete
MNLIDIKQERQIRIIFALLGIIGAVTTISLFIQSRKHKKADDFIRSMELEIKTLELQKLKNEKKTQKINGNTK